MKIANPPRANSTDLTLKQNPGAVMAKVIEFLKNFKVNFFSGSKSWLAQF